MVPQQSSEINVNWNLSSESKILAIIVGLLSLFVVGMFMYIMAQVCINLILILLRFIFNNAQIRFHGVNQQAYATQKTLQHPLDRAPPTPVKFFRLNQINGSGERLLEKFKAQILLLSHTSARHYILFIFFSFLTEPIQGNRFHPACISFICNSLQEGVQSSEQPPILVIIMPLVIFCHSLR